jgi:sterol desaturase/sphingolipid hydroxylase (fatty acid hydroxylase superfamily)
MDDALHVVYVVAALVAIVAATAEGIVLTFVLRRAYDWRGAFVSLAIASGRRLTDLVPLGLTLPFAAWLFEHRVLDMPVTWWSGALLFVGLELGHYVSHRFSHRVRWLWTSHSVHHSSSEVNIAAGYRLGWTGKLTFTLVFLSPLAWLGFAPAAIATAYGVSLVYQLWLHAAWIPPLGPVEGILNTPSAHRVHHGTNPEYRDKNFGGVLVIFDRLFGTYAAERTDVVPVYGWSRPLETWNPFLVLLTPWIELSRDLHRARGVREIMGALFGAPS